MNVSVVIPTYNSSRWLPGLFSSLVSQSMLPDEVIFVDDGSSDGTLRLIKDFAKSPDLDVKFFSQIHSGPAAARNLGAKEASGDVIVFLDSDCVPTEKWLDEMVKPLENKEVSGVQGAYKTLNKESLIARYVGLEILQRHEGMRKQEFVDWVASFSAAYRRDVFLENGGFNEFFLGANAEDIELSFRLRKKGSLFVFNPKAVVAHPHPSTLHSYLRQQFWRGFWRIPMYLKHKTKLVRDSYTGSGILIQALLSLLVFLSLASLMKSWVLISLTLLLLSNLPRGFFCFKHERKFLVLAPVFASLRSLTGTIGALYGLIFFFFLKPLRRCVS